MSLAPGLDYYCPVKSCTIQRDKFRAMCREYANKPTPMAYPGVAVSVVIFDAEGRVLLGKRKGELGTGQYSVPGGKVDFGETPYAAALREVKEETNLDLDRLQFTDTVTNDYFPDKGKHYINLYYSAHMVDATALTTMEPEKIESWGWYNRFDIPQPIWMPTLEALNVLWTGNHYHFNNPDIDGE